MKKIHFTCLAFLLALAQGFAQAPVISPISGPSNFCYNTVNVPSFSTSASNSPTNYSWGAFPNSGVQINPTAFGVVSVSFPNVNKTYTLYCSANNSSGSSQMVTFVVNVFQAPTITFSGNNNFCQGSSTNLSASPTVLQGSSTLYYTWSPAIGLNTTFGPYVTANPQVPTTYTVSALNGPCTTTTTILVNPVFPMVGVNITSMICQGELTQLTAFGATSYSWSTGAITDTIWVNPPLTASYTVMGTDTNGCSATLFIIQDVDACTGIKGHAGDLSAAGIYPNPSTGKVIIYTGATGGEEITLQVINITGQVVIREKISDGKTSHDLTHLPDGIYTVVLQTNSAIKTLRLVKQ